MSRSLFRQLNLRQIALILFLLALVGACSSHAAAQITGTVSVSGGGDTGGVFGGATASFSGDCTGTDDGVEDYYGFISVSVADYGNSIVWTQYGPDGNSVSTGGPASPGDYTVTGSYSGFTGMDSNGNPCSVSGDTEYADAEVPFYPTATTVNLTTSSFQEGVPVTIPVLITNEDYSPTVSGIVTLNYGSATLASATVTQDDSGNGDATITASSSKVPPGNYSVYVAYSGDGNAGPSNSSPFTITILPSQLSTTTTLSATPNPVLVDTPVEISVTIAPTGSVTPTGAITLLESGKTVDTLTLTSADAGTASVSVPADLPAGTYTLQALYSGDKFNLPSTSAQYSLTVEATTMTMTTLTISPTTLIEGNAAEISVVVKASTGGGTPTGSVTLTANGDTVTVLQLANGSASIDASTAGFAPGAYTVQASYSGDAKDHASRSLSQQVTIQQATSVVVTASPNPVTQGSVATITATVKSVGGVPITSGTITFSEGGSNLGTASLNSSGVAQLPIATSALAPGDYSIKASFPGNSSYPAAWGSVGLVVNAK